MLNGTNKKRLSMWIKTFSRSRRKRWIMRLRGVDLYLLIFELSTFSLLVSLSIHCYVRSNVYYVIHYNIISVLHVYITINLTFAIDFIMPLAIVMVDIWRITVNSSKCLIKQ